MEIQGEAGTIDDATYEKIKNFIYDKSGIALGPSKKALVTARVRRRMRELGLVSHADYFKAIMDDATGVELVLLVDAISTNVTSFYREKAHFDILARQLAEWASRGQAKFRIWSAACSSGEEPYSMAFTAAETLPQDAQIKILATDISTKVLGMAHQGVYEDVKCEPVPAEMKLKYMDRLQAHGKVLYAVKPRIRELVMFKRLNLTDMPFPMKGDMDAIFCRNVMIYFDKDLRRRLVAEFHRLLKPGGCLVIGHTESLIDINNSFKRTGPSVYIK